LIKVAIPLVHVSNSVAAEEFYCGRLGFRLEFAHTGMSVLLSCVIYFSRCDEMRGAISQGIPFL